MHDMLVLMKKSDAPIVLQALNTKKVSHYCTVKDKSSTAQRSSVIYQITWPGCLKHYVGKTDRKMVENQINLCIDI